MNQFVKPIFRDFGRIQVRAISDDTPNGGGAGCGNVTGYLDSYGTMTLPNSFADTIPFLFAEGFLCDGHGHATNGYTEGSNLGYFTKVDEDAEGLQLEWAYHSKVHSQDARSTLSERLAANKTSGLSIGFFVGDGRTAPVGWVYDPEEDMPEGIDYITVRAQHFEEVLSVVSKPEFLKDNMARAANLSCIYLFKRVHVFEVSQTLTPANEVSLVAEVRNTKSISKTKSKTMATNTRAKREDDDDDSTRDDAVQAIHRTHRAMKNEHKEYARAMKDHMDDMAKHLSKLAGKKDDDDARDDDDDDHGEPDGDEPKKKSRARTLFNGGVK